MKGIYQYVIECFDKSGLYTAGNLVDMGKAIRNDTIGLCIETIEKKITFRSDISQDLVLQDAIKAIEELKEKK